MRCAAKPCVPAPPHGESARPSVDIVGEAFRLPARKYHKFPLLSGESVTFPVVYVGAATRPAQKNVATSHWISANTQHGAAAGARRPIQFYYFKFQFAVLLLWRGSAPWLPLEGKLSKIFDF